MNVLYNDSGRCDDCARAQPEMCDYKTITIMRKCKEGNGINSKTQRHINDPTLNLLSTNCGKGVYDFVCCGDYGDDLCVTKYATRYWSFKILVLSRCSGSFQISLRKFDSDVVLY